jgi:hypothetical protein
MPLTKPHSNRCVAGLHRRNKAQPCSGSNLQLKIVVYAAIPVAVNLCLGSSTLLSRSRFMTFESR